MVESETSGTSYDFWRLLVRSPHIARYHDVQSLFITDIQVEVDSEDDQTESNSFYGSEWLVNDKHLPRCALLLHNVKAFSLTFEDWDSLPSEIYIVLLRLMSPPSLLGHNYPSTLFDIAIGDNIKHVALHGRPRYTEHSFRLRCLPVSSEPLYVDSLDIHYTYGFLASHFNDPNCRIKSSSLRKLVVITDKYDEHASIWAILQTCRETLEDFVFAPSRKSVLITC